MGRTAHIGEERVQRIREWANELGFSAVGISRAERLEDEEPRLAKWLAEGQHGQMGYLERNFEKRLDPRLLLPRDTNGDQLPVQTTTAIKSRKIRKRTKISTYAFGEDYHFVVKWKLKEMPEVGCATIGGTLRVECTWTQAPILERAWAKRSGLGWVGKHGLILNKTGGSHFFLGEILVDLGVARRRSSHRPLRILHEVH